MKRRTIVIGDVHGCLYELGLLLNKIDYNTIEDRLVFAGDLLDRGPKPIETLDFVMQIPAECVLGNHEEKHIRAAAHAKRERETGVKSPMQAFHPSRQAEHDALDSDMLQWLEKLPPFINLNDMWTVVHAGFLPEPAMHVQDPKKVCRIRYLDKVSSKMLTLGDMEAPPTTGAIFWTEAWKGPRSIVYGHNVDNLESVRCDEPVPGVYCYGIDTGCVFGGRLTAFILCPDGTHIFESVPAKQAYAKWRPSS